MFSKKNSAEFFFKSPFSMAFFSTFLRSLGPVVHAFLMLTTSWQWIALIEAFALTGLYFILCSGKGFVPRGGIGWLLAILNVSGSILFFLCIRMVGPIEVTLWLRSQSLFTALLGAIFLSERHSPLMWFTIGLSFLGAFIFSYSPNVDMPSIYNLIVLLLFCLSLAVRNFLVKVYSDYDDKEIVLQGSWIQLVLLIWLVPVSEGIMSLFQVFCIVIVAILCHGLSTTLFIRAIRKSNLSQIVAVRAAGPVITCLISSMIFPAEWNVYKILGINLSLISLSLMTFIEVKKVRIKT